MESKNIYESVHHNAVFQTPDQVSPSSKRDSDGRNEDTTPPCTNYGCDDHEGDHDSYEVPLNTSILPSQGTPDAKRTGMSSDNELYESYAEDIMAAENAKIRQGIRKLATSSSSTEHNSSFNCALVFCMFVLLLASIGSSSYVFYQYEIQRTRPCLSNGQSLSFLKERNGMSSVEKLSLRRLANEIKKLEDGLKHLKSNSTKISPQNSREARRRFRELVRKADSVETNLQAMEKRLGNKIMTVGADFNNSIMQFNTELLNMSQVMVNNRPGIAKCVFKTKSSDSKKNQTASIIEKKGDTINVIGVTCCTQYSHDNLKYRAFLKVEDNVNITYSCQCSNGTKCDLCYWQCK